MLFLFTQIHSGTCPLLFNCITCCHLFIFCVGLLAGRTIFHETPRVPLVHVSKHDTGASVTHSFPLCSPCVSKVCRTGVVLHIQTGPSGAKGTSAAVGHELLTRSKSLWSHFIIGGINLTSLSLGQTERDGGQYNKPNGSKATVLR